MSETKKPSINYGLNLLRVLLCFCVVLCHFWRVRPYGSDGIWKFFATMCSSSVPVFMTMAFFFAARRLGENDFAWLRQRLVRLWKPFLFWSVIAWSVAKTLFWICGSHGVTFGDLILQLLLGANNNVSGQFWFHSNLIMLTIGFFAFYRLVSVEWRPLVLGLLVLGCFVFQYTELNLLCFGNLPSGVRQPFGRLCGTIVYAILGISLASMKPLLNAVQKRTKVLLMISGAFAIWFLIYLNPCPGPSFNFVTTAGEKLPSLGSIGLRMVGLSAGFFLLFYYLPIDKVPGLSKITEGLSRYCMGIYCVHMFLGWVFNEHVFAHLGLTPKTFTSCLVLWLIAWAFCWLIARIPFKLAKEITE